MKRHDSLSIQCERVSQGAMIDQIQWDVDGFSIDTHLPLAFHPAEALRGVPRGRLKSMSTVFTIRSDFMCELFGASRCALRFPRLVAVFPSPPATSWNLQIVGFEMARGWRNTEPSLCLVMLSLPFCRYLLVPRGVFPGPGYNRLPCPGYARYLVIPVSRGYPCIVFA